MIFPRYVIPSRLDMYKKEGLGIIALVGAYYNFLIPLQLQRLGDNTTIPTFQWGGECNKGLAWGVVGVALFTTISYARRCCCFKGRTSILPRISIAMTFGARLAGLRLVERYIDDPNDAMNTLRILQTMVETDNYIRKLVTEVGGIETTVKVLRKYSDESEGVAANGSGLLRAVCGYNDNHDRLLVMECGGINVLVSAMKHWPENEDVQANACMALDLLAASCDIAIQKKIVDVGGLVAFAEARTKHQHDVRVGVPAARAIMKLVTVEKEL